MPFKLSPSSISLYFDCPRCFWLLFNKGIRRPPSPFPTLPSGIDRILKQKFDAFRARRELPPELSSLDGKASLFPDIKKLEVWRDSRRGLRWQDDEGNILFGAVDDLLLVEGKIAVLDYKTKGNSNTQVYAQYKRQMELYNFLLHKNGMDVSPYAYILFFWPIGLSNTGHITFSTKLEKIEVLPERGEALFKEVLDVLKSPNIPSPSPRCEYCKWTRQVHEFFVE